MEIEYGNTTKARCVFCFRCQQDCKPFRILENNSFPPLYRTLYTFKLVVCLDCINRGNDYLKEEITKCMDEYIGGKDEMLRSCGLQPCTTGS